MNWNTTAAIFEHAGSHPGSPAIATQGQTITYERLRFLVAVMARHLRQAGVQPGQVAGVSMAHHPLQVVCMLALSQIGAVLLPLHMAVPTERRLLAARRFGAAWIVSGREEMRLHGLPFISLAGLNFDGHAVPPDFDVFPTQADSPFRIALSSGTSGDPKGVLLSHGMRARRARHLAEDIGRHDRVMTMDLNFAIGYAPAMAALEAGACLVLPHSFLPADLFRTLVDQQVTHVSMSPAQAQVIVDSRPAGAPPCPSLSAFRIVGGRMPSRLLEEVRRKLTPHVYTGYGATELGSVAVATPEILRAHPDTVGSIRPWVELEIVDENDRALPAGTQGFIRTRSEDQVEGYHLDEERTARHFRGGWFYSGDMGWLDHGGLLFIEGRSDDQLNLGGMKLNPEDIENTLTAHAAVQEAGAFLLPDGSGRETFAVAVVMADPARLPEVRAYAQAQLGPLAPKQFLVVESLPRTITGKLRRAELGARFSTPADTQRTGPA